jgi:hypothetical protein
LKRLAGLEPGKLAHDAVALHRDHVAVGLANDPFAALDRDRFLRLVRDRNEIHEHVRAIRRTVELDRVNDLRDLDGQAGKFTDFRHDGCGSWIDR